MINFVFFKLVNTDEQIIKQFQIYHDLDSESELLPENFTVDFKSFEKRFFKKFYRIENEDSYSFGKNKIFTNTKDGIENVEIDHNKVRNFI